MIIILTNLVLAWYGVRGQQSDTTFTPGLEGITMNGQWFLSYEQKDEGAAANQFRLKRGYVTVKKTFNRKWSARVTQDIVVDHEGDGEGEIEIRLKYGYLRYYFEDRWFWSDANIEFGLVHRPWIDFVQKINPYRVQGTMYMERYELLRSADYGVTFNSLLGGALSTLQQSGMNSAWPGRYGSLSLGVFNGGGYNAIERNNNKLVEGRLSLRPFPTGLPGWQLHYNGTFGKGNTEAAPDFVSNLAATSYERKNIRIMALFTDGAGNGNGTVIDTTTDRASDVRGYSLFADYQLGDIPFHIFARYDLYTDAVGERAWTRRGWIAGIAYRFMPGAQLVIDYDFMEDRKTQYHDRRVLEAAVEFTY